MLQRIQSVYLFIALILIILMAFIPFYSLNLTNNGDIFNFGLFISNSFQDTKLESLVASFKIACIIEIVFFVLTNIITIFKFKKRKLQLKLCKFQLFLLLALYLTEAYSMYYIINNYDIISFSNLFNSILLIVPFVLILLASKAIKSDEKLIRAADRIR